MPERVSNLLSVLLIAWLVLVARPSPGSQDTKPGAARAGQPDLRRISWHAGRARAPDGAGQVPLTLELGLQRAAEQLLARAAPRSAGAVMIDARSGRVLVWAEHLARGMARGSVLLDLRAPAASVFKLVTAAALLERAHLDPRMTVCHVGGRFGIGRAQLERPRSGPVRCGSFGDALGHSRNAVFAQLTTRYLTRQDLIEVASRFGFNAPVPFDAVVPAGSLRVPYSDLEVARTAVGFQGNTLSVLGGAQLAMIIASGGQKPRLAITERDGSRGLELVERALEKSTARRLTRMMEVTVHSGTSRAAFSDESGRSYLGAIRVAGKTGTLHPDAPDHTTSWFVGFAPSREPEVVVSVLLQNGAIWRKKANEVARDLLRAYFFSRGAPHVLDPLAGAP